MDAFTLLLIILLLAFLFIRPGLLPKRRFARPDHFHWLIRAVAALLALAAVAVAATAIGTWRGLAPDPTVAGLKVLVPTLPPHPLPEEPRNGAIDIGPRKLIGTVILVRVEGDRLVPLGGESKTVDWTGDSLRELTFAGSDLAGRYTVEMSVRGFRNSGRIPQIDGILSTRFTRPNWSSSSSGGSLLLDTVQFRETDPRSGYLRRSKLSLIPNARGETTALVTHLTLADPGDPLTGTPVDEWLRGQTIERATGGRYGVRDADAPPGIRMLIYAGPSAFLLGLVAAAGALCFRHGRRGPAFAGLLAAMVLYVGALDAMALQRRAAVMNDASQSDAVRQRAMDGMRETFFHAGRAERLIAEHERSRPADR